jgi:hypothetical protein
MNARFWQLVEQADDEGGDDPDIRDEVFAKLIVRECGKVYIQNQQDGVMTLTQNLLQHFGVEE